MSLGGGDALPSFGFATSLQQLQQSHAADAAKDGQEMSRLGAARPIAPAAQRSFNAWAEGYWGWFDQNNAVGDSTGHVGVLFVGADYLVSQWLLLGAMVQYDDLNQKFEGSSTRLSNNGWLAGPYAVVRLSDSVFFQTRAAWGRSDNEITLGNSASDDFDTDRWLVKGRLLAKWRSGDWLLSPSASVAYITEDQNGYTNTFGDRISGRTISLGQAKFGPEISYQFRSADSIIVPSVTLEGIWNFAQDQGALQIDDDLGSDKGIRGRVEAGVMIFTSAGYSFGATAAYDGIGDGDYSSFGGKARVKIPLD